MNKRTPAYYFEKLIGPVGGILAGVVCIKWSNKMAFVADNGFDDKLLTVSTTLFGFLLTVLTLIVQSTSEVIANMKRFGSYIRLIKFNRRIVLLSAAIALLSFALMFIKKGLEGLHPELFLWASGLNFGMFVWMLIDAVLFVAIFYKILIREVNNGPQ